MESSKSQNHFNRQNVGVVNVQDILFSTPSDSHMNVFFQHCGYTTFQIHTLCLSKCAMQFILLIGLCAFPLGWIAIWFRVPQTYICFACIQFNWMTVPHTSDLEWNNFLYRNGLIKTYNNICS